MNADPLREALQKALDEQGDGWNVAHYVTVAGLERLSGDGCETTTYVYAPGQPDYITEGLLLSGERFYTAVDEEPEI
jgi:hypothetical protein